MSTVIILQRVVPHYRFALFERLWLEFGWFVVTGGTIPDVDGMKYLNVVRDEHPFIKRFDFKFPWKESAYRCRVPVAQILEETRATAVICEFAMYMNSTYRLSALRRLHGAPKLLFWSHGFSMERGLSSSRDRLLQLPRTLISALADGHVCYSEEGREYLSRFMSRDRLFVAPNTLDIDTLRRTADSAPALPAPGRPHIVSVGRITPLKDYPRLVRIFRALLADHPDAALTIVGDGPDFDRTRAAVGDELDRRIFMPGAEYDEARIAAHFGSADLSVLAGAAGLGVNHALCYGVPVVAFDRTAEGPRHHPEIAYVVDGLTGLRVRPYTDAAMVEALRGFLRRYRDPRAAFAGSIARYVTDHLSLDSMVREFARVDDFLRGRMPPDCPPRAFLAAGLSGPSPGKSRCPTATHGGLWRRAEGWLYCRPVVAPSHPLRNPPTMAPPVPAPAIGFVASGHEEAKRALERLRRAYPSVPPERADVIVALGGDGFMLETLHRYLARKIPIFGMNRGSVGFLMNTFGEDNLIERVARAEPIGLNPLRMTAIDINGDRHEALAINEVSLLRETRFAAKLCIEVDEVVRMPEMICDGVLLATPAGSTAYNVSLDGPILPLGAQVLALTPISVFRPRQWRGALLPHDVTVTVAVLSPTSRPVSAVADYTEVRDVVRVIIREDRSVVLTLLFDPEHNLEERIIKEQFLL